MAAPRRDPFDRQIQNRNYLANVGFNFTLARFPKVDFFSNTANLPGLTLGTVNAPNYLKELPLAGDRLVFEDFSLQFIVDEKMENYLAVHNWMRGLGFPNSIQDFKDLVTDDDGVQDMDRQYSDGTLLVLNNQFNNIARVKFNGLFPYSLSGLQFDATDTDYTSITATVTFKYTIYNIETVSTTS
jgi:hypothetical protein|tara:strand:+ start:844 stop:1398 length:555 start_codon:yes stop_codon:yes gene_type:complete